MFNDIYFLFLFLPVLLIVVRNITCRLQKAVLVTSSIALYIVSAGTKGLVSVLTIAVNYLFHLMITKYRHKKALLAAAVILDGGLLAAAKISGFMPLGISFIIFQLISFQIDMREDRTGPWDYLMITMFFPKVIMGPIIRARDMLEALRRSGTESLVRPARIEEGLKLYTCGLFLKCVLADNLATLWHSINVSGVLGITAGTAWLGAFTYSLELYFDFWGYSLMAVAVGRMFGFSLPANFNEPYSAVSVGDFWRRWHITLGQWFRDYVYIPLGGKRCGNVRCFFNLLAVWLLTALWHGISVNFLIWGLYLFVFIALERFTFFGEISRIPVLRNVYLIFVIVISWMIFAIDSPGELWIYIKCLFGVYESDASVSSLQFMRYVRTYWYLILTGLVFASPLPAYVYRRISDKKPAIVLFLCMLGISVFFMVHNSNNVFMYYSF